MLSLLTIFLIFQIKCIAGIHVSQSAMSRATEHMIIFKTLHVVSAAVPMLRAVPNDAQKEESMDYNYYTQVEYPMRVFEDLTASRDIDRIPRILNIYDKYNTKELSSYSWYSICLEVVKRMDSEHYDLVLSLMKRGDLQNKLPAVRYLVEVAKNNGHPQFELALKEKFRMQDTIHQMTTTYDRYIIEFNANLQEFARHNYVHLYPVGSEWLHKKSHDTRMLKFVSEETAIPLTDSNFQLIFLRSFPVEYFNSLLYKRRVQVVQYRQSNENFWLTSSALQLFEKKETNAQTCTRSFKHEESEYEFWRQQILK